MAVLEEEIELATRDSQLVTVVATYNVFHSTYSRSSSLLYACNLSTFVSSLKIIPGFYYGAIVGNE